VWCNRNRFATEAWISSGDTVQDAPLTASATTLNVSLASGVASDGLSPRFQVGQLLRIESEYLVITGISTNALTVGRGARGSTAAIHVATTAIDVFRPQPEIVRACALMASFNYANIGKHDAISFDGNKFNKPIEMPDEVKELLEHFTTISLSVV
jgi:hypothetical protein